MKCMFYDFCKIACVNFNFWFFLIILRNVGRGSRGFGIFFSRVEMIRYRRTVLILFNWYYVSKCLDCVLFFGVKYIIEY